jgi:hypothetical protein
MPLRVTIPLVLLACATSPQLPCSEISPGSLRDVQTGDTAHFELVSLEKACWATRAVAQLDPGEVRQRALAYRVELFDLSGAPTDTLRFREDELPEPPFRAASIDTRYTECPQGSEQRDDCFTPIFVVLEDGATFELVGYPGPAALYKLHPKNITPW